MEARPPSLRLWSIMILLIVCTAGLAGSAQETSESRPGLAEEVDVLLDKVDPDYDDWAVEQLSALASGQLRRLGKILQTGDWDESDLSALIFAGARSTTLRPDDLESRSFADGTTVTRTRQGWSPGRPAHSAHDALRKLTAPFEQANHCRIAFKIIGVATDQPGSGTGRVRYEGFARKENVAIQQTATWKLRWAPAPQSDGPLITTIELLAFEELVRPALMFTECTGTVLADVPGWREQLLHGAEYWFGRTDAVGELHFMGHQGIAVADVNGDGLEDLYVAMATGLPNKLLLQNPDGTVRDVAAEANVAWLDDTKGVLFADMDNDGDQDLLCAMGPSIVLCKNDGRGKFHRFIPIRAPTPAAFYSLAVADFDSDGDLDIYGCRYVKERYGVSIPIPFHDANNGPTNHLLRNDGNDMYTDVTAEVGLNVNNARFSLAAGWGDYDADGDLDLYVANDFGRNNLYRNDRGRFVDVAARAGVEDQAAGMGVSWSDFDVDGDLDLYVSNMFSAAGNRIAYQDRFHEGIDAGERAGIQRHSLGNTLLVNRGDGTFGAAGAADVRMGRWAWGAMFVDLNNDGYDDIVVPNGFLTNERVDDL